MTHASYRTVVAALLAVVAPLASRANPRVSRAAVVTSIYELTIPKGWRRLNPEASSDQTAPAYPKVVLTGGQGKYFEIWIDIGTEVAVDVQWEISLRNDGRLRVGKESPCDASQDEECPGDDGWLSMAAGPIRCGSHMVMFLFGDREHDIGAGTRAFREVLTAIKLKCK